MRTAWRWVLAPLGCIASHFGFGFAIGWPMGELTGALVAGGVAGAFGVVHGFAAAAADAYDPGKGANWAEFVVDNTWSVPNSLLGSFYVTGLLIARNPIDASSAGSGSIVMRDGIIPGFATTLGNVIAGAGADIQAHEQIHVLQARIFGPLYIPLVLANYVVATVLPYWLIYHNWSHAPIRNVGHYFMRGVYPHVWNEEWAYAVQGTPPGGP